MKKCSFIVLNKILQRNKNQWIYICWYSCSATKFKLFISVCFVFFVYFVVLFALIMTVSFILNNLCTRTDTYKQTKKSSRRRKKIGYRFIVLLLTFSEVFGFNIKYSIFFMYRHCVISTMATTRKTLNIGNFGVQVCIVIRNNIVLVVITLSRSRLHLYIVTGFVMGSSRCLAVCLCLSIYLI